jgi:hypothetical protein
VNQAGRHHRPFVQVAIVGVNVTAYTDTGLIPGTSYADACHRDFWQLKSSDDDRHHCFAVPPTVGTHRNDHR